MLRPQDLTDELLEAAEDVGEDLNADVVVYSGELREPDDWHFAAEVGMRHARDNVLLFLTTPGGSADAAYRLGRCLQLHYDRVSVCVATTCKSAGTLVAIGANELVLTRLAELGPLDVQITKPDTIGERVSGLTPLEAMTVLRVESFETFEYFFLEVQRRSGWQITTRTAARIAANMTSGLLRPIYAQLDPMRLGEYQRAMTIASAYGSRLNTGNLLPGALETLLYGYPSHEFVIDFEEAGELFQNVREPRQDEGALILHLLQGGLLTIDGRPAEQLRNQPQTFAPVYGYVAGHAEEYDDEEDPGEEADDASPPAAAGGPNSDASRGKPKANDVVPQSHRKAAKPRAVKPEHPHGGADTDAEKA